MAFVKLFAPGRIGEMTVKNRIVMPPMGTNLGGRDGWVTEQMTDYYEERARGGAGLVIVEAVCVDYPIGKAFLRELNVADDRCISGLRQLSQAIHKHDCRAALQLHHAGRDAQPESAGLQPLAPSAIAVPGGTTPREMTSSEVEEVANRFVLAAERAREAGFDAVEIHAAAGYLVAEFLSPASNKRSDRFGGDVENRANLLLDIIRGIKLRLGQKYPVWCRINAMEYGLEGSLTLKDSCRTARMAQEAGADAIHYTVMGFGAQALMAFPSTPGSLLPLGAAIKGVVSVPVLGVGRIDPERAEKALREGEVDFISIGRGLIADPELPKKVAEGSLEDIRPCIACNRCGERVVYLGEEIRCSVNPAVGRERQYQVSSAEWARSVLIVGGGPAGMEAAIRSASRGHKVTLCEKEGRLGGLLLQAARPPGKKAKIEPLTGYLVAQVAKQGVAVRLGQEVGAQAVRESAPDVVIVATGAVPLVPDIPGVNGSNVVLAGDVLTGNAKVGDRVVIIGGEQVACETADLLSETGKRVMLIRRGPRLAVKMQVGDRANLLRRLRSRGVNMLTGIRRYEEITPEGVVLIGGDDKRKHVEADTVVIAAGAKPSGSLFEELRGIVPRCDLVGDSVEPRSIMEAIEEGSRAGLAI